jgi:hypothetical protein
MRASISSSSPLFEKLETVLPMSCAINDSCSSSIDVPMGLAGFLTCRDSYNRISLSNGFFTSILILEEEHFLRPSPSTFSL